MKIKNYRAFKEDLNRIKSSLKAKEVEDFLLEDNQKNRDYLVHTSLQMIENRAHSRNGLVRKSIEFEDLLQNGVIGAMEALNKWFIKTPAERREFKKFKNFAYIWVEKYIKEYIDMNSYQVSHGIRSINDLHKNYNIHSGNEEVSTNQGEMFMDRFSLMESSEDGRNIFDNENNINRLEEVLFEKLGKKDGRILMAYFGFGYESRIDLARDTKKDMRGLNIYCKNLIKKMKENLKGMDTESFVCMIENTSSNFT